ncbi:hypothetical protein THERMOT_716 [Bathymodiolus thermophilus thioautotrophic gill symbiont]|nr:hypothetical protein THERMOT_716 [Bathymodiolus thermophilus thioautotrophic gill symbiont]
MLIKRLNLDDNFVYKNKLKSRNGLQFPSFHPAKNIIYHPYFIKNSTTTCTHILGAIAVMIIFNSIGFYLFYAFKKKDGLQTPVYGGCMYSETKTRIESNLFKSNRLNCLTVWQIIYNLINTIIHLEDLKQPVN